MVTSLQRGPHAQGAARHVLGGHRRLHFRRALRAGAGEVIPARIRRCAVTIVYAFDELTLVGAEVAPAQSRPQNRFAVAVIVTSLLAEAEIEIDLVEPDTEVAERALLGSLAFWDALISEARVLWQAIALPLARLEGP